MGFIDSDADDRVEYLVVAQARGKLKVTGDGEVRNYPKARLFVLEDRTAVAVIPGSDGLTWENYPVGSSRLDSRSKLLTVTTTSGSELVLDGEGCGCNMGEVGNAGPADGPYRMTGVRDPEWHTVA